MKGLVIALQFLTRLPTPRVRADDADFAASIRWFPAAGLIVGLLVALAGWGGGLVDPWLGALAALTVWVATTGALHLDGLGDLADALGAAHKDRDRLLAVLADPHVGSFGVVAIALQLAAKLVLLHLAVRQGAWAALVLTPAAARIGPLLWARRLHPLHPGLGARFQAAVRRRDIALWWGLLAVIAPAGAIAGGAGAATLPVLAAPALMLLIERAVRRRLGGISGDVHGAGIELMESGLLLAFVVALHLAGGAA